MFSSEIRESSPWDMVTSVPETSAVFSHFVLAHGSCGVRFAARRAGGLCQMDTTPHAFQLSRWPGRNFCVLGERKQCLAGAGIFARTASDAIDFRTDVSVLFLSLIGVGICGVFTLL